MDAGEHLRFGAILTPQLLLIESEVIPHKATPRSVFMSLLAVTTALTIALGAEGACHDCPILAPTMNQTPNMKCQLKGTNAGDAIQPKDPIRILILCSSL